MVAYSKTVTRVAASPSDSALVGGGDEYCTTIVVFILLVYLFFLLIISGLMFEWLSMSMLVVSDYKYVGPSSFPGGFDQIESVRCLFKNTIFSLALQASKLQTSISDMPIQLCTQHCVVIILGFFD